MKKVYEDLGFETKINMKEPIIMKLYTDNLQRDIFNNIKPEELMEDEGKLIILNPQKDMVNYMEIWSNLIFSRLSGSKTYPILYNIDCNIAYEYMILERLAGGSSCGDLKRLICTPYFISDKRIELNITIK